VQTKITIRHMEGISPTMRVIHGTNLYDIQAVLGQARISLTLMCTRQT
jgi:Phage head-tail joining protein